jgi:hypothetical protein
MLGLATPLAAQSFGGIPQHEPLNPASASRSALLQLPYREASPGRWRVSLQFDYGSAIEYDVNQATGGTYLLDAELMRTSVNVSRDLGTRDFVMVQAGVQGAYDGLADGFFYWYHNLIGFYQPERLARPKNVFGYQFELPDRTIIRDRMAAALTDTRLTYGVRWTPYFQSAVTATLPTSTGPEGYGRGVPGIATIQTLRVRPISRVLVEATAGVGYTPRHGQLGPYQQTAFASASTGLRINLWGAQSIYGYLFYHTASYANTGFRSLDRREFTGDFGWMMKGKNGTEWRFGLAEDLAPGDAGIDLILKVGRTW